jgi:uncharacterized membrane protein YhhN
MRTLPFSTLQFLAALASVIAILLHFVPAPALVYVFTPLATILITGIAFANWRAHREACAFWITIGLLFSLAGDLALLQPDRYFLPGLAAFLLTHVAYLVAFTRDVKFPARFSIWLLYLGVIAAIYVFLLVNFPAGLKLPIACYSVLLASMAAQAAGRSLTLKTTSARLAAIGGLLLMLSDTLLTFDRFHAPLTGAPALILTPYYLGQLLIASSTTL